MRKLLFVVTLVGLLLGKNRRASAMTYIFSSFKGDDAAGMKLSIFTSGDSVNFTLLSDTGFGGNTTYLRDPSIMKYSDGKYYIAYTDPTTASCCNPEDHFGIGVSSDLIHWTNLATVKAGVPNVSHVWAPEWFIESGVVRVIANIDTGHSDFQPYAFTAQDSTLTSWSGPAVLGIGTDYIDTFVAKLGSTYHAFIKSELTRFLEHATAPSLTGPWTFVGKGDWAGWGNGLEGPAIVKLDDGRYRMYVDPQQAGAYQYMTSSDLNTWSTKMSVPAPAGPILRHGTVIRDELAPGLAGGGGSTGTGGMAGAGGSGPAGGSSGNAGSVSVGDSSGAGGANSDATGAGGARNGGSTGIGASSGIGGSVMSGAIGTSGVANSGMSGSTAVNGAAGSSGGETSSGCSCRLDRNASGPLGPKLFFLSVALFGLVSLRRRGLQPRKRETRNRAPSGRAW